MVVSGSPRPLSIPRAALALLVMGLLGSMATLRADLLPDVLPNLLPALDRECLGLGLFSAISAVASFRGKSAWPRGRSLAFAILIGLGLFIVPTGLSEATVGWISPITRAALFTLTPIFAVVFEPYLMRGEWVQDAGRQEGGALLASILSAAGTLLALPISVPSSLSAIVAFGAISLAAACSALTTCYAVAATRAGELTAGAQNQTLLSTAPFAAVATATACLGIGAIAAVREPHSWHLDMVPSSLGWEAAIEIPALLLLFWLIPRTTAPRFASRFTLALLFPVVIEAPLLGPRLTLLDWSGVAMMTSGAAYLLFARQPGTEAPGLSLR